MAVIMTVEGSGALPPGMYTPTRSHGRRSAPYPAEKSIQSLGLSASWYRRTLSAESVRASRTRAIHRVGGGLYGVRGDFDVFLVVALYEQR